MLKKLSIVATLLVIIGITGSLFTYKADEIQAMDLLETVNMDSIDRLTLRTISTNVTIMTSTSATEATIELNGEAKQSQIPSLSVDIIDNELVIEAETSTSDQWFEFDFNFDFYVPTMELLVILPEKYYDELDISTVSGDIFISNLQPENSLLSTVSGDIEAENLVGINKFSTTSGDVVVHNEVFSHPVTVDTVSGDVDILVATQPTDTTIDIETISGDIYVFDENLEKTVFGNGSVQILVDTVSGDIDVNLK